MRQKVRALAALTSQGDCEPPPPREFMAPQMPGARKLQIPRMRALNHVERYQRMSGDGGSVWVFGG